MTRALAAAPSAFGGQREGVVVRVAGSFPDHAFAVSLGKWVRTKPSGRSGWLRPWIVALTVPQRSCRLAQ